MKLKLIWPLQPIRQLSLLALFLATLNSLVPATAHAQGTAFTYQCRLDDNGTPANGVYDLRVRLFDSETNSAGQIGPGNFAEDLAVSNGLFTVTLDFGTGNNRFNGDARWLQISVRPGDSTGAYNILAPRQRITPSPYALFAAGADAAGLSGTLPVSTLTGVTLNASNLTSGTVADARLSTNVALRTGGNTFTGTQIITNGEVSVRKSLYGLRHWDGARELATFLNSDGGWIGTVSAHPLHLYVANYATPSLTAAINGNVGIGTTAPGDALQIGELVTGYDQYLSIKTDGGNLHRAGIKFRHFDNTGGFNIEDDERVGTNGLHFVRYPFGAPVSAMFIDRFNGNVGIGTTTPATKLDVAGEVTTTAVNITSDRNAKAQFTPVNSREILAKVTRLPITEWQYKSQGDSRHIGPMAQDFREAFGVGRDEKHITTVDADGVALAAIQGLNQVVQEQDAELGRLKAENQSLAERLAAIEHALRLNPTQITSSGRAGK